MQEKETEQALLDGLAGVVRALVEITCSIEAKVDGERLSHDNSRKTAKVACETLIKAASELCDVVTRMHSTLCAIWEEDWVDASEGDMSSECDARGETRCVATQNASSQTLIPQASEVMEQLPSRT